MRMHPSKLALLAVITALCATSSAMAQQVRYQQTSATGLNVDSTTRPTAADDITFAPGSTLVLQQLSAMTFGVGVLPGTTAQTARVFVDFYNTVNPAAVGSVLADPIGSFSGTLNITANTGTGVAARSFTFSNLTSLSTPILFNDDNIGIAITFADAAGTAFSTVLTPLMSNPGTPTVGASATGVYRDSNANGTFESTEFVPGQGNLYLSITTVAVPEPATFAMVALGGIPLLVAYRRKAKRGAAR